LKSFGSEDFRHVTGHFKGIFIFPLRIFKIRQRDRLVKNTQFDISGKLFLHLQDARPIDLENFYVLEKVAVYGSISRTAKEIGMSYPKVWHIINNLNRLSQKPLVERTSGGKGGGGSTCLTEEGMRFLKRFRAVKRAHSRLLRQMVSRLSI
jgi:molybdate transport system regulatory protein